MVKKIVILVAATLVANVGWTAPSSAAGSKEERVGFGSGAAIGALAGPLGIMVGATVGAILGDRFHEARAGRADAEQALDATRAELETLHVTLGGNERELARLNRDLTAERETQRELIEQALDLEVPFKTGQSVVESPNAEHLATLGKMLATLDGVIVTLDGFADVRGDEQYNEQLSADRANAVKQILVAAGLPEERIVATARGEESARAGEHDLDGLALDRRVHLSVYTGQDTSRVAQQ